jgi:putative glutathione S-transferase
MPPQRWLFRAGQEDNVAMATEHGRTLKGQFPAEQTEGGEFQRQEDAFRDWVTADGRSGYPAEPGRYHLYVSWACPWAHRTIIVRKLKQLESVVGMTVVDPIRDENGWAFRKGPGHSLDPINGFNFLSEAYRATDPHYRGRVTVPVLWDGKTKRIVSNSDDDIMRMFNHEFACFTDSRIDLYPAELATEIDGLNIVIYEAVNNGVCRAGFATSQRPYERAVRHLFDTLDHLEARLRDQRYLFGGRFV